MTTKTIVNEVRSILSVGGIATYRIALDCTDKGDLPDTGLFVYQIVNELDPQTDVFVRIAELVDVIGNAVIPNTRSAALSAQSEYFRSDLLTKDYTDLDTANSAVTAIFDRINALTNDYNNAYTNFIGVPTEDIEFPSPEPSEVENLKTAYNTSYDAYNDALAEQSAAEAGLAGPQTYLATVQTALDEWKQMLTYENLRVADLSSVQGTFNTYVGQGESFTSYVNGVVTTYGTRFGSTTLKIDAQVGGYVSAVVADLGKTVVQTYPGGSDTGTLVAYNNTTRTWWVVPIGASTFLRIDQIEVDPSPGTGVGRMIPTSATSAVQVGMGPMDSEITTLRNTKDTFVGYTATARTEVVKAGTVLSGLSSDTTYIQARIDEYTALLAGAQQSITDSQVAYNTAQGNTQTAYTALEDAYDAAKTVCPNWTPENSFPPTP